MRVVLPTSATCTEMTNWRGATTEVPGVAGDIMRVPFGDVTALEWLRKLVAKQTKMGIGHAEIALKIVELLKNESDVGAAHRLVLLVMVATISPSFPHHAEEE